MLENIISSFHTEGHPKAIVPLGNGLINDTYRVNTDSGTDYVLQRINTDVFTDVDVLQHNIEAVTDHIRNKLSRQGVIDLDRHVLRFITTDDGNTYKRDDNGQYWRMSVFVERAVTYEQVTAKHSLVAGEAFANFELMLTDLDEPLGATIPDFHNMELRARQLDDSLKDDPMGRADEVSDLLEIIGNDIYDMQKAERLYRDGLLPKRVCHCDTKVNNLLFDRDTGEVLCVIDLDTVMPSFIFSDYGDFLRTGANYTFEDDPDISRVGFNMDIFRAFTKGYLSVARTFLLPIETSNLTFAVALFPFMQGVRFLTDYLNGDIYYKTKYEKHNLIRARNQFALYNDVLLHSEAMDLYIDKLLQ